ncbi:unnamed protein product [Anisakis simplex]|uniref:DUF667 domain-containing protein n=1 Tax=Anisakis simplex TaxID=6269 RepID=A0A0M3K6V9_ANISI|nr:unnamed protein product [Anisakis simplex]
MASNDNHSWTLVKYTKLHGMRYDVAGTTGDLRVTINAQRRILTITIGSSNLEQFSLNINPPPTVKSKGTDVVFHVMSQSSSVTLARFRLKFLSEADHSSFVSIISCYFFVHKIAVQSPMPQPCAGNATVPERSSILSERSSNSPVAMVPPPRSMFSPYVVEKQGQQQQQTQQSQFQAQLSSPSSDGNLEYNRKRRNFQQSSYSQPTKLFCEDTTTHNTSLESNSAYSSQESSLNTSSSQPSLQHPAIRRCIIYDRVFNKSTIYAPRTEFVLAFVDEL